MKKRFLCPFVVFLILSVGLSACAVNSTVRETPDIEATAASAIAATQTADANLQATIEAGIAATQAAQTESTAETGVVMAEETAVDPSEYYQLTEEELAALIDQSVEEAVAASEQAASSTTQAAADDTISQEEWDDVYYYSSEAEELILLAEELLEIYTYLYGDYAEYADEMIDLLYLVEDDLDEVLAFMVEVLDLVESGQEITPETLMQLADSAQEAGLTLETLSENQELILSTVETMLAQREDFVFSFDPDETAGSRAEALLMAKDYAQTLREALGDQKISAEELEQIAQLGANAAAGLQSQGGVALSGLPEMINQLTTQAALGQFSAALQGLQGLESAIPGR